MELQEEYITMKWFLMYKESRRRFNTDEKVRYFTKIPKGKGKGLVFTPPMEHGRIKDWVRMKNRYLIEKDDGTHIEVHPRNISK